MKSSAHSRKKIRTNVTSRESGFSKKSLSSQGGRVLARIKKILKHLTRSALLSKTFQMSTKVVVICGIVTVSLYGVYHFVGKTFAGDVIVSKSEIVARVSKLVPVPEEPPYDVVRVEDELDLQKQNPFYKNVKEGDYILMYKDMAIVYDLRSNTIVARRTTPKE